MNVKSRCWAFCATLRHSFTLSLCLWLQRHTGKYKPPPCDSQWKFECSFGGCTFLSSPAWRKNLGLVSLSLFWGRGRWGGGGGGGCLLTCIPHRANPLSHRTRRCVPNTVVNRYALSHNSLITTKSLRQNHLTSVILPLCLMTLLQVAAVYLSYSGKKAPLLFLWLENNGSS